VTFEERLDRIAEKHAALKMDRRWAETDRRFAESGKRIGGALRGPL
jgi:hypothetical protein